MVLLEWSGRDTGIQPAPPPSPPHTTGRGVDQHGALVWWESTPPSPWVRAGLLRNGSLEIGELPKGQRWGWLCGPTTLPLPAPAATREQGFLSQLPEIFKLQKPQSHQICLPTQRRNPQAPPSCLVRPDLTWVDQMFHVICWETFRSTYNVFHPKMFGWVHQGSNSPISEATQDTEEWVNNFTRRQLNKSRRQLLCSIISQNKLMPWKMDSYGLKRPEERCPLDCKEIKPVNPRGNQSWIFIGRTDAEAESPVLWSSDMKRQLTGKVPDDGKDQGQKEKRASRDEMAGWHHWLDGCESGWTPGVGDGQEGLARCDSWGCNWIIYVP